MRPLPFPALRRRPPATLAALALVIAAAGTPSASAAPPTSRRTVPVVMLSDIHFDPFSQPSKLAQLRSEPVEQWAAILAGAPAETDQADFVALQRTCRVRGIDSDYALMHASLEAAHAQQPTPLFVTLSGDLMAHGFDCKFRQLAGAATTAAEYSGFAAKTVAFVSLTLRGAFPGIPVYIGLGNNDSGCTDYHETPGSDYLKATSGSIVADLPAGARGAAATSADLFGDYSAPLPRPMGGTRLIVLQDIYESRRYQGCGTVSDPGIVAEQQMTWLRTQLSDASAQHQPVWVMAHIPPGVDVYATLTKGTDVCGGKSPDMFLSSDALTKTVTDFASTVRLVVLAHSHMDEMRLLHSGNLPRVIAHRVGSGLHAVPAKLVPSVSPINGNNPAFTVAQVDPRNATLVDYAVYAADSPAGAHWAEEYRYSSAYHEPDFSAASADRLLMTMREDKTAADPATTNYSRWFYAGDSGLHALALRLVWPSYSCALTETTEAGYRSCACPAKPTRNPAGETTPATSPQPAKSSPQP